MFEQAWQLESVLILNCMHSLLVNMAPTLSQNGTPVIYKPFVVTLINIKCWRGVDGSKDL